MSRTTRIFITVSIVIFITNITIASDWREDAKAIDISGGENHTLILTQNKWPWGCGDNRYSQLGIGDANMYIDQKTLVRVWDGDMNTPSDYLENINDIDANTGYFDRLSINSHRKIPCSLS